jgi:tetratricopeptide (TPR) repeat protein
MLATAGAEGDSSDAAGWLALYQGNLKGARALLRAGSESTPELALALGLVARIRADSAQLIGHGFLQLARGDSVGAATTFVTAADATPDGASLLLATAARIRLARGDTAQAVLLWNRILETAPTSPEAPQAELAWARALRAGGKNSAAESRLEHLILTYPDSALLPQARRELDLVRGAMPAAGGGSN